MSGVGLTDMLLDILGNRTRRRILGLLAEEPCYLLRLSKELDVTMPAIQRHLEMMEDCGLISSFEEKSDLGAPPRRCYRLKSSVYLTGGITSDFVKIEILPLAVEVPKDVPREFSELQGEVKNLRDTKDHRERLKKADEALTNVDDAIKKLDDSKVLLLRLRQEIRRVANEMIEQLSETSLEKRVLQTILGSPKPPDPELISAQLEIRERTVEDLLKELERKGIAPSKRIRE